MTPGIPVKMWVIFLWKITGPEVIVKGSRLKQKRPHGVMNAVSSCERSSSCICIEPTTAVKLAEDGGF